MKAPTLNRKLVLEEPQRLPDGAGGFSESWIALGTLWADVRTRTGRARESGGAAVASVGYRITVRAAPEGAASRPRPDQRFRDGARNFRILAVAEADHGARYLTCFAKEEVAS